MKNIFRLLFAVHCLLLASCSPAGIILGAGATAGTAAVQERGLKQAAEDAALSVQIQKSWADYDFEMFRRLNLTVHEARALLTGYVANLAQQLEAVRRTWQVNGVKEVINEIEIDPESAGIEQTARDARIAANLRAKLTFDDQIYAVNYAIDVVRGVVYMIGVAQSQQELDRAINHAKSLGYVQRVKSYVRVKGE